MKDEFFFDNNLIIDKDYNTGIYILFNNDNICYSQKNKNIANIIYRHLKDKKIKFTSWNYIINNESDKYHNVTSNDYHEKASKHCINNNTKLNANDLFFQDNINISDHCGIYFLYLDSELKYIGSSDNVFRRIANYIATTNGGPEFNYWNYFTYSKNDLKLAEAICIAKYRPPDNNTLPGCDLFISQYNLLKIKNKMEFWPKKDIHVGNNIYYGIDEVIKSLNEKLENSRCDNVLVSKKTLVALEQKGLINELLVKEEIIKGDKVYYQLIDVIDAFTRSYKKALKVKEYFKL